MRVRPTLNSKLVRGVPFSISLSRMDLRIDPHICTRMQLHRSSVHACISDDLLSMLTPAFHSSHELCVSLGSALNLAGIKVACAELEAACADAAPGSTNPLVMDLIIG